MSKLDRELMRGAGPAAVLSLLSSREMYGYELVEQLDQRTDGVLKMGQSTLYPLLYNLEAKGLVKGVWRSADSGRDRKYYHLTAAGKKRLARDAEQLTAFSGAMKALGLLARAPAPISHVPVL